MPEQGLYPANSTSTPNAPAISSEDVPATCQKLADGSIVFPRFAILDECKFFDKNHGEVHMTAERLQKIAQRINDRIERTGDAPGIIAGHTQQGVLEEHQPRVVGKAIHAAVEDFVNPITKQPVTDESGRIKKALYVTPIADKGEFHTFKKLRRGRSVELWLDPDGDDIDPIALLGANTPRRDLGPHHFQLSGAPHNLYKFSRHNGSQSVHFEIETEDEGDDMADMPGDTGGNPQDGNAQAMEAAFENSSVGKRLMSLMDNMESYMPMLQQMHEMFEQSGAGGQDMPTGGPGGDGGPQGMPQGAQPPMPAGGTGAPEDEDDLFAPPAAAGHQGTPTPMGSAGACSPTGPMNGTMPGMEPKKKMGSQGVPPAEPMMPMHRDPSAAIQFAQIQRENADLKTRLAQLEQINLASQVQAELNEIAPAFEFDYAEQFQRLMTVPNKDQRAKEIEYIVKHFRRKQDTPPGGGQFAVPTAAIQTGQVQAPGGPVHMSRAGGMLTPQQAQTEFGRQQLLAQQQAAQQQPGQFPMSDAEIVAAAQAIHATRPGEPVKFQGPVGANGMSDVMALLAQYTQQKKAAQQPNGVAVR